MTQKKAAPFEDDTIYRVEVSEVVMVDGLRIRPSSHANLTGRAANKIADKIAFSEKVDPRKE